MKSYTEQKDTTYISTWKNPKRKIKSKWSIVPEVDIFPYEDDLSETKARKRRSKLNKIKDKINIY